MPYEVTSQHEIKLPFASLQRFLKVETGLSVPEGASVHISNDEEPTYGTSNRRVIVIKWTTTEKPEFIRPTG